MTAHGFPTPADVAAFLARHEVTPIQGLAVQDTDTCYQVNTSRDEFVLGLSTASPTEPPFSVDLITFLTGEGIPCASVRSETNGQPYAILNRWSATLEGPLSGSPVAQPTAEHCERVGDVLARLHVAGRRFPRRQQNERGPIWWRQTADELSTHLPAADQALLREELRFQSLFRFSDLPQGVIHGRPTRKHVRFEGRELKEISGFHHACSDMLLLDVANAITNWCQAGEGLDGTRARALLEAYASRRSLSSIERGAWPVLLRSAALEQWLSTLKVRHLQKSDQDNDAEAAKARLLHRIAHEYDARALWPTMNGCRQA